MIKIQFGPEGYPQYFFIDDEEAPKDAIEVTEEQLEAARSSDLWLAPDGELTTPPVYVPPIFAVDRVTMRQAKLALSRNGLLTPANEAIASLVGSQGDEARIEWETASHLNRSHPLVSALGVFLNLSESRIDDLFEQAAAIQ